MRDKYFLVFTSSKVFVKHKFYEERIKSQVKAEWFPVSISQRTDLVRRVQREEVNMNDNYFLFSSYFADVEQCFSIHVYPPRELPFKNNFWNAVTFELQISQHYYTRSVYSFLDLLAQVGGLKSMLGTFCTVMVVIF